MPRNNEDFGTGNKLDPRVFMEGRHIGFQDQSGNFMNFDQDTAAQEHFNRMGYNKGTAGDMLKNSKARMAESTEGGEHSVQHARKQSKRRTADREELRERNEGYRG